MESQELKRLYMCKWPETCDRGHCSGQESVTKPCLSWNYSRSWMLSNLEVCLDVTPLLITATPLIFLQVIDFSSPYKDQKGQISHSSPKFLRHASPDWLKELDRLISSAENCFSAIALVIDMTEPATAKAPFWHLNLSLPSFKWFTAFL